MQKTLIKTVGRKIVLSQGSEILVRQNNALICNFLIKCSLAERQKC